MARYIYKMYTCCLVLSVNRGDVNMPLDNTAGVEEKVAVGLGVTEDQKHRSTTLAARRKYFLERIGLPEDDIDWPKKSEIHLASADYQHVIPYDIQDMYGLNNLSKLPIFQGGYINFGYWTDSDLSKESRIRSSENLYQITADAIELTRNSRVLDVGCGLGYGCMQILRVCSPAQLFGMDSSSQQLERARKIHEKDILNLPPKRLEFVKGDATKVPFEGGSFTHIISVEVAQHFSIEPFVDEVVRVLKPGGKLAFSSFFATSLEGADAINALIPDRPTYCSDATISDVERTLSERMKNIKITSIGQHVWPMLDKWLINIGFQRQWTRIFPALHRAGLVDYFLFQAQC